jgi:hypothetical protein
MKLSCLCSVAVVLSAVVLGLLACGCGQDARNLNAKVEFQDAAKKANERAAADFAGQEPAAAEAQPPAPGQPAKQAVPRKIKYTADLKLITDEFDTAKEGLEKQVQEHQGYEAHADVQSSPGAPRVGTWKVRVPIEKFAAFRSAVRQLGEILSDTVNTEDLTEQYYDLEANIKNLRAEQESWRDMLKKTSDKVESLISVKRELDRVTDEIQRKEGRLRLIANLTDLTTVNIQIRERQKYVPVKGPDAAEDPTFAMRAGKIFGSSWDALVSFGQAILLFVIALAPWLPLILAAGILLMVLQRRRTKAPAPIVGQPPQA